MFLLNSLSQSIQTIELFFSVSSFNHFSEISIGFLHLSQHLVTVIIIFSFIIYIKFTSTKSYQFTCISVITTHTIHTISFITMKSTVTIFFCNFFICHCSFSSGSSGSVISFQAKQLSNMSPSFVKITPVK